MPHPCQTRLHPLKKKSAGCADCTPNVVGGSDVVQDLSLDAILLQVIPVSPLASVVIPSIPTAFPLGLVLMTFLISLLDGRFREMLVTGDELGLSVKYS